MAITGDLVIYLNWTQRSEQHSPVTLSRNWFVGNVPQKDLANDVMDEKKASRTIGSHELRHKHFNG